MKTIFLIFLFPTLLFSNVTDDYFLFLEINCPTIGPFYENSGPQNIDLEITNYLFEVLPATGKLEVKVKNPDIKEFTYYSQNKIQTLYNETVRVSVPIPTQYFVAHKVDITLNFFINQIRQVNIPLHLEAIHTQDIYIEDLEDKTYSQDDVYVEIIENRAHYSREFFDFSSFKDILEAENYYRLSLDQFNFDYSSIHPFSFREAYLSFEDKKNIFPLIIDNGGIKLVPLSLKSNRGKVSLSYDDTLYVEPTYLLMALNYQDGLIKSKHFYFPINRQKELNGAKFMIHILKSGAAQNNYHFSFKYFYEKNLIGDCQNSDYCVVGGIYR